MRLSSVSIHCEEPAAEHFRIDALVATENVWLVSLVREGEFKMKSQD